MVTSQYKNIGDEPLIQVENLSVEFHTQGGVVNAVNNVSFSIREGERVGIVGESGAGKSVTAKSIMQLIEEPGKITSGRIQYQGEDVLEYDNNEIRDFRGEQAGLIFQNVQSHLNPVYTVGDQVAEAIRLHNDVTRSEAKEDAIDMLTQVGIPDAEDRYSDYPHSFSGGMKQRVLIAIALACDPDVLIADEPTTALDVTTEAQILRLIKELCEETGTALLFISHDLSVIAELCNRVIVMYAGEVVEQSPVKELFEEPLHPYTEGLLQALPSRAAEGEQITSIPGEVPDPIALPGGCSFHPRCPYAVEECTVENPPLLDVDERKVRCYKYVDDVEVDT
ncbi:MAG: ABC transporter ATP-binding protein [Halobacteriaceae archaeon]